MISDAHSVRGSPLLYLPYPGLSHGGARRMQLEYNHRVIWLMQGQGPVQLALDLALAAQSAEERSAAVTEQVKCCARALHSAAHMLGSGASALS